MCCNLLYNIRSPLGSRIYERSFGEMGHRNPPLLFQPQTKNSVFENDFPSASISGTTTKHKKKYKPTDSLGLGTLHAWSPLSLSLYRAGLFVIWNFTSLIFEKRVQRHQLSINDMHARNDFFSLYSELFAPLGRTAAADRRTWRREAGALNYSWHDVSHSKDDCGRTEYIAGGERNVCVCLCASVISINHSSRTKKKLQFER